MPVDEPTADVAASETATSNTATSGTAAPDAMAADTDAAIRIVLADDHHFFRAGLRRTLSSDGTMIVGETSDGARVAQLVRDLAPDVLVLDLKMPNALGIEALRQTLAASPQTRVLILTVSADQEDVIQALAAGACGYLLKDAHPDELISAVHLAAAGHAVLSREVARELADRVRTVNSAERAASDGLELTERELEVLRLMADGADNAQIGRELSISPHTVKQYVTNIFEKLGVSSRVQAAVYAVRNGLV
jgi:two-component system, NarL family, nitrate/nitrite response regulator NarL